jgi:hypothetical protein
MIVLSLDGGKRSSSFVNLFVSSGYKVSNFIVKSKPAFVGP